MKKVIFVLSLACAAMSAAGGGIDVQLLDSLLSVKSVSRDKPNLYKAVDTLRAWLEARGVFCTVETNECGMIALYAATTPGKTHDYLFVSHVDVVPAPDSMFEPRHDGDWVHARGACDTKGNVVVAAQVLANLVGKASVGMMIATDEEGGKIGTATPQMMVDRGYLPRKMVLVGDTAGEEPGQLFVAEKGHARIRLVAHGKGGHSSRPWALDNPIPKLCAGYLKFAEAWAAENAAATGIWRTVASPTMLEGSAAGNVVPDTAVMHFSCRFTTMEEYERICDCARRTSGCEVVAPKVPHRLPVQNREGDPEIAALFAALSAEFPGFRLGRMSAATDATYYVHLGLPIVIFASESYGAHAQDERGSVSSLHRYADVLTRYLSNRTVVSN